MENNEISFICDDSFSEKEKDYIYENSHKAEKHIDSFLGKPEKNKWTISRFKHGQSYYETDYNKKTIYLGRDIFLDALMHEIIHAWHGLNLSYDFIEEGITCVAVNNLSSKLNFIDNNSTNFSKSNNFSELICFDPVQGTKSNIHLLDFYRTRIIFDVWMKYEKKTPGLVYNIINELKRLGKQEDGLKVFMKIINKYNKDLFKEFDNIFSVNLRLIKRSIKFSTSLNILGGVVDYGINKALLFVAIKKVLSQIILKNNKVYPGLVDHILKLPNDELLFTIESFESKKTKFKVKVLEDGTFGFKYDNLSPGIYNIYAESNDGKLKDKIILSI